MKEEKVDKKSFDSLLGNRVVVNFVKKANLRIYRQCTQGQEKEITTIFEKGFDLLIAHRSDPTTLKDIINHIIQNLFKHNDPNFWFRQFHDNCHMKLLYKTREFEYIKDYIKGGTILDMGCGEGYLALKCSQEGYTVLTTDVLDYRADAVKHLPFKLMTDPSTIPYPNNSTDTAFAFYVLHHISADSFNLRKVLKELKRVSSRIIIGEDVYGVPPDNLEFIKVIENDDLLQEFMSFSKEDQFKVLMLNDFFINAFIKGIPEMNFPFQFKTIPEWNTCFIENGFKVVETILIGFKRGMNRNCHLFFIVDSIKR